jgi:hypothetical protein
LLQPAAQCVIPAIDRVARHPGGFHPMGPRRALASAWPG